MQRSTAEYKIKPIKRKIRELLGYPYPLRVPTGVFVEQWVGISLDEVHRAKDSGINYARNRHPLLELGWARTDCERFLRHSDFAATPKSSCLGCLMWNLDWLRFLAMVQVLWTRYPLLASHDHGRRWLQFTANPGRAPNTIDAYGRAVEDHLRFCALIAADPLTVRPDEVAAWIGDMLERPNPRAANVVHLDSGAGLANATIQQRLVAVQLFYDFLVEDGLRERNPVRRGQSGRNGRRPRQGLVRRVEQAPWIPNESAWESILTAAGTENLRNRLMLSLAYDGALRREELVRLDVGDFEPAHKLVHLRAVTTKSKRSREVAYGETSSVLFSAYLVKRRELFDRSRTRFPRRFSAGEHTHGAPRPASRPHPERARRTGPHQQARARSHPLRRQGGSGAFPRTVGGGSPHLVRHP